MSSNTLFNQLTKMTEGELRQQLFDIIGDMVGPENIDGEKAATIKTIFKAYANASNKRLMVEMNNLKNQFQDRMKGDGKLGWGGRGEIVDYPKCPKCGGDIFGQAFVGADIKEIALYCSNIECVGYKVRFIDLKKKV